MSSIEKNRIRVKMNKMTMKNQNLKDAKTVAAVDDEEDIRELLSIGLAKAGYKVKTFEDGSDFDRYIEKETPDAVLLDMMLPDTDGIEILKSLKSNEKTKNIPVIMLTAKSDETDKIVGLELGADDYVTKPFSLKELAARIKAVLRRNDSEEEIKRISIGKSVVIDILKHEVSVDGKLVELTSTEFNILVILAEHKGWVMSRDKILRKLWGSEKMVIDRTVDVHIKKIREKLGKSGSMIKNIRAVGYKIEE
jgi:DNA-binding response OmpR family regulator